MLIICVSCTKAGLRGCDHVMRRNVGVQSNIAQSAPSRSREHVTGQSDHSIKPRMRQLTQEKIRGIQKRMRGSGSFGGSRDALSRDYKFRARKSSIVAKVEVDRLLLFLFV